MISKREEVIGGASVVIASLVKSLSNRSSTWGIKLYEEEIWKHVENINLGESYYNGFLFQKKKKRKHIWEVAVK